MASTSNRIERWGDQVAAATGSLNRHLFARHLIFSLCTVLFYLLLNRPEVTLVTPELGFTAWYPASGLVLAVMLCVSPRYFPLLVGADALASAAIYHQPLLSWSVLFAPVIISGSYAAAAYILRGPLKIDPAFGQRRDVVRYLFVSMTAAVPAMFAGVFCLAKDHTIPWSQFWESGFQWYMGDVIGLVGFGPFLLLHVFPWTQRQLSRYRAEPEAAPWGSSAAATGKERFEALLEGAGQFGSIALVLWIMFGGTFGTKQFYFLAFVPIIWIAIRQGVRRIAIALLVFDFGIVLALKIFPPPSDLQLRMGLLMLAVSGTGLLVGAEVTERQRVGRQLGERTEFLNSLVEHNPLAISIRDNDGRVQFCNDAFVEMFQYARDELLGNSLDAMVRMGGESGEYETRRGGPRFGQPERSTVQRVRKDGKVLDVELHEVAFDLGHWRSASYAIYRDVSEQVKLVGDAKEHAESLDKLVQELQTHTMHMSLLNNMGDLLQCCGSMQEALAVVSHSAKLILSESTRGALFVFKPSRDALEVASSWGQAFAPEARFRPEECWALRRGQAYWSEIPEGAVICSHIRNPVPASYLCVPLVAQGETLGIFHVQYEHHGGAEAAEAFESAKATQQRLAQAIAGQVALSLASLRLRETLREQSIRDPLTGLFNRRFMQESLNRELLRSKRKRFPLAVVFLDLDHFKRFNDTFGHDAGDAVLRSVAEALRTHYRADDIACRYGGEEFAIILPESNAEEAAKRSEELRAAVKSLRLRHEGKILDGITLSIGIAAFPEHASGEEELLRLADIALYQSKSKGRDCVTVCAKPV